MGRRAQSLDGLLARAVSDGPCLIWTGALAADGRYGSASYMDVTYRVHRLVYQLSTGVSPEGSVVMHSCDRPLCINPYHLSLGSHADNVDDKVSKGRQASGEALNHPHRKMDWRKVSEMRALRAEGHKVMDLASRFGVSKGTVLDVVHYRTWRKQ